MATIRTDFAQVEDAPNAPGLGVLLRTGTRVTILGTDKSWPGWLHIEIPQGTMLWAHDTVGDATPTGPTAAPRSGWTLERNVSQGTSFATLALVAAAVLALFYFVGREL